MHYKLMKMPENHMIGDKSLRSIINSMRSSGLFYSNLSAQQTKFLIAVLGDESNYATISKIVDEMITHSGNYCGLSMNHEELGLLEFLNNLAKRLDIKPENCEIPVYRFDPLNSQTITTKKHKQIELKKTCIQYLAKLKYLKMKPNHQAYVLLKDMTQPSAYDTLYLTFSLQDEVFDMNQKIANDNFCHVLYKILFAEQVITIRTRLKERLSQPIINMATWKVKMPR